MLRKTSSLPIRCPGSVMPATLLAGAALSGCAAPVAPLTPPPTDARIVVDYLHGIAIEDPFQWLEGDNSDPARMGRITPEVTAWTDTQNAFTREVLDARPGRAELEARLRPLLEIGSISTPMVRGNRYFYTRREGTQAQPVWHMREGIHGASRPLIDPVELDPTGLTTVTWLSPNPDGTIVAYGFYTGGDEITTLALRDVRTGEDLPLRIGGRVDGADWLPDGSGFVYRNLRDAEDPYSGQVMFHRLGTDPAEDALLFRQLTPDEDSVLATTWGPYGALSRDGRWLTLIYFTSTRGNDLWVADFQEFLETGELVKRDISIGGDGWAFGFPSGDHFFVHTTKDAPNGRVDRIHLPTRERRTVVAERDDAVIEEPYAGGVAVTRDVIAINYLQGAVTDIRLFSHDGEERGRLRLPGIGSASLATEPDASQAFVRFGSFNEPNTILRVNLTEPDASPEVWERPDVPIDPASVQVRLVRYASKDGTPVSMFIVHRRGLVLDGARPTILYGYGGFGISMTPSFIATLFPWFEDGGVFALPHLRGGGEYGAKWHEAGMLGNKQNVFDDFIAAAEWLQANGYTNPARLAVSGGSNGGLLTGAVAMQRPDLMRAAIVDVPLLDMLRYQKFLMARYWVPEYGSAEDPEQYHWLRAYSPYHNVRAGVRYPAIFLSAGENDARTHPMHARKMAARLQAALRDVPDARPVLLWVDRDAGHGGGKPLELRLRDATDRQLFLRWQLGMEPRD